MMLLCGISSEPPLRLVIEAAEKLGKPYVLFNQRASSHTELSLELRHGHLCGMLRVQERDWPLETFSGVYVRMMDHRLLPENSRRGERSPVNGVPTKSDAFHESFYEWLELCDGRVMNRNSAMSSNMSKPYQAQFITQVGFHSPPHADHQRPG